MKTKKKEPAKPADKPQKRSAPSMEYLPVSYTPAERLDLAEQLARASQTRMDTEDQKKANDAEFKETMEGLNLAIKRLTRRLTQGSEMRNVECKWILEDPTPKEKTLVRLDTGEVVRIMPMQDHDFQELLPITPATAEPGEPLVLEPTNGAEARAQD